MKDLPRIPVFGHRGCRGYFPENTVTSFIEAVKSGVQGIEMDVVISKDGQVVVSHEPWMNEIFCTRPDGIPVDPGSEKKYNLHKMDYAEIVKFDCGVRTNPDFPLQRSVPEHKPLLSEVIEEVESYCSKNNLAPVIYMIEIKSEPGGDGIFQPAPGEFVELVYAVVKKYDLTGRSILQSFDVRILREIKKKDGSVTVSFLVESDETLEENLQRLGFTPEIYGPEFVLVSEELLAKLKSKNIKLIPWTLNNESDIIKMIRHGVNGIITDYPDRVTELLKRIGT
jgi:glycerophosphoryl diester phosphodiesterase